MEMNRVGLSVTLRAELSTDGPGDLPRLWCGVVPGSTLHYVPRSRLPAASSVCNGIETTY